MKLSGRISRWLAAFLCVLWLISAMPAASSVSYPYETKCNESVNMRRSPSASAIVLYRLQVGDSVTVLGETGQYYQIKYMNITGYAMKQYVDGTSGAKETAPVVGSSWDPPSAVNSYPYDTTTIVSVKLRKTASDTATVLEMVPQNALVTVLDMTGNGYAKVRYGSKTGYVAGAFINLANITAKGGKPLSTPNPAGAKYTILKKGSSGLSVGVLQEGLIELKYYEGEVDSKFGAQTETAVNAFKKRNGMQQDGIADTDMQLLMYEGIPKDSKGYRKILKTMPSVPGLTISSGKVGEPVRRLQERLKELGYYLGELNGACDKATIQAIKDFQTMHGIKANGEADTIVQDLLYGGRALSAGTVVTPTPKPTIAPPKGTVREGDKGEDVKAVQQRLKDLGYFKDKVDGKFSASSVKALKAFQEKSRLKADGVCGAITRAALFGENAATAVATAIPIMATPAPQMTENMVTIQAGSRGDYVLRLQQRLMDLGYYASRLDGVYLEDDITAIRAFQKANRLVVDGKAGPLTQSALYSDDAVRSSAFTAPGMTLRYGSAGSEVTALQNRLIELGYLSGGADGKFGVSTKAALIDFQKASNLVRDGVAGTKTQAALYDTAAARKTAGNSTRLEQGATGSAVKDLQTRLIALGYLKGRADGKFGAQTNLALVEFQKRNNLLADGVAGRLTLATLNSSGVKPAAAPAPTPVPGAIALAGAPSAANVRYDNWYTNIKSLCNRYPNATVYDFVTGLSWQVKMFSFGAHADAEPLTANDTANMNRAFGGVTTWNPKAVWVLLSNGVMYMASTHNTPHDASHITGNNFPGHLCIHFPRTAEQVKAIGAYATSHQKAIDLGWQATLRRAGQ